MKKFLCFFGIFALLFLVLLPPSLRAFLPKKDDDKDNQEVVRRNLRCSNKRFIIGTSYDNDKIRAIVFKRFDVTEEPTDSSNPDTSEPTDTTEVSDNSELNSLFQTLKVQIGKVTTQEDGEVVTIDFSVSNHEDLSIDKLNKGIEEQQKYYEQQGLTCSVM